MNHREMFESSRKDNSQRKKTKSLKPEFNIGIILPENGILNAGEVPFRKEFEIT